MSLTDRVCLVCFSRVSERNQRGVAENVHVAGHRIGVISFRERLCRLINCVRFHEAVRVARSVAIALHLSLWISYGVRRYIHYVLRRARNLLQFKRKFSFARSAGHRTRNLRTGQVHDFLEDGSDGCILSAVRAFRWSRSVLDVSTGRVFILSHHGVFFCLHFAYETLAISRNVTMYV